MTMHAILGVVAALLFGYRLLTWSTKFVERKHLGE